MADYILKWLGFGLLIAGGSSLVVGCSAAGDPSVEAISEKEDELAAWNVTLWPRVNNKYAISVCFKQRSIANATPTWTNDKTRVQNVLTETWEAASAVDFQFQGDCPSTIPSAWMPIELAYHSNDPGAFWGFGQGGRGARLDAGTCSNCQVILNYGANYFEFETLAVHETGHALGLRHERSRADFPGCTVLDTGQFFQSTDRESGPLLTREWDIDSVMSQWECSAIRRHDSVAYYQLSGGDRVGINFIYPRALTRGRGAIGSYRGFYTNLGMLIRPNGSVITDWDASGAHANVFSTTPVWSVKSGTTTTSVATGYQLSAATLASRTYDSVHFSFTDTWGRTHQANDNVIISAPRHTGILMSTLIPL